MTTFQLVSLGIVFAVVLLWKPKKTKAQSKREEFQRLWKASVRRCIERWECPQCGDGGLSWTEKGEGKIYHCGACISKYYMDKDTVKKTQ